MSPRARRNVARRYEIAVDDGAQVLWEGCAKRQEQPRGKDDQQLRHKAKRDGLVNRIEGHELSSLNSFFFVFYCGVASSSFSPAQ
jgi:hypothetical protein